MARARRYNQPPEVADQDTEFLDSMGWTQLDYPDAASSDILCIHSNMEVLARLMLRIQRKMDNSRPAPVSFPTHRPIKNEEGNDAEAQAQRALEEARRKQESLRAGAREHLELFTDYYGIWREKDRLVLGEFSSFESEATVFFNTVRDGYLRQDFAQPDDHPLVPILNSLSIESRVILFKELE